MYGSTSTPPSCVCCCFCHLNSVHSLPLLFIFTFSRIYFWILSTTAPTSSYSVLFCFCLQRGHFQLEHCGGDDHAKQYVHCTLLFLLLVLSLEFCPLTPVAFFFYVFMILFMDSVHHGIDILLQRSDMLMPSTGTFPSGTLRR